MQSGGTGGTNSRGYYASDDTYTWLGSPSLYSGHEWSVDHNHRRGHECKYKINTTIPEGATIHSATIYHTGGTGATGGGGSPYFCAGTATFPSGTEADWDEWKDKVTAYGAVGSGSGIAPASWLTVTSIVQAMADNGDIVTYLTFNRQGDTTGDPSSYDGWTGGSKLYVSWSA
jgi:hypothetical protein